MNERRVFLQNGRPWLVQRWGGELWVFRWHPDRHWVSDIQLTEAEFRALPDNLSQEEQDLYHELQASWEKKSA